MKRVEEANANSTFKMLKNKHNRRIYKIKQIKKVMRIRERE